MRILGIDMGQRRIGTAISDELGITAQALKTIDRVNTQDDLQVVCDLVQEYEVGEIVIGYPLHLNGTPGQEAEGYVAFGKELQKATGVPVFFWDERLTTVAAEKILLEGNLRRRKRRRVIDQIAACLLLEGYLTRRQRNEGLEGG